MENASKALLIAAAVLMAMLIASLAVFVFNGIGSQTSRLYGRYEQSDIDSFNQVFFQFENRTITQNEDGKWNGALKIQDVVSIINYVKDNNSSNKMPVKVRVTSNFSDTDLQDLSSTYLEQLIYENIDNNYKCTTDIPSGSQFVETVFIEKLD